MQVPGMDILNQCDGFHEKDNETFISFFFIILV